MQSPRISKIQSGKDLLKKYKKKKKRESLSQDGVSSEMSSPNPDDSFIQSDEDVLKKDDSNPVVKAEKKFESELFRQEEPETPAYSKLIHTPSADKLRAISIADLPTATDDYDFGSLQVSKESLSSVESQKIESNTEIPSNKEIETKEEQKNDLKEESKEVAKEELKPVTPKSTPVETTPLKIKTTESTILEDKKEFKEQSEKQSRKVSKDFSLKNIEDILENVKSKVKEAQDQFQNESPEPLEATKPKLVKTESRSIGIVTEKTSILSTGIQTITETNERKASLRQEQTQTSPIENPNPIMHLLKIENQTLKAQAETMKKDLKTLQGVNQQLNQNHQLLTQKIQKLEQKLGEQTQEQQKLLQKQKSQLEQIEATKNQIKHKEMQKENEETEKGWKEKYVQSCVKITTIIKEKRILQEEIGYLKEKLSSLEFTLPGKSPTDEIQRKIWEEEKWLMKHELRKVHEERSLLELKVRDMTKLIAKLTKMNWDQTEDIQRLKLKYQQKEKKIILDSSFGEDKEWETFLEKNDIRSFQENGMPSPPDSEKEKKKGVLFHFNEQPTASDELLEFLSKKVHE